MNNDSKIMKLYDFFSVFRIKAHGLRFERPKQAIGRYNMLKHDRLPSKYDERAKDRRYVIIIIINIIITIIVVIVTIIIVIVIVVEKNPTCSFLILHICLSCGDVYENKK